jgi:hypothetical protein
MDHVIKKSKTAGSHKTGTLYGVTVHDINLKLGFRSNIQDDPDKVKYSWGFTVDGEPFGIWDYKSYSNSPTEFSTYGDKAVLAELFGIDHVR